MPRGVYLRKRIPSDKRFLEKVVCGENPGDCWYWLGSTIRDGYGKFMVNKGELVNTSVSELTAFVVMSSMRRIHTLILILITEAVVHAVRYIGKLKRNRRRCKECDRLYHNLKDAKRRNIMRKPTETEKIRCPESVNKTKEWEPKEVFDASDGTTQGILKDHVHRKNIWTGEKCDYSGLPVPIITRSKEKGDSEKEHRPATTAKSDQPVTWPVFLDPKTSAQQEEDSSDEESFYENLDDTWLGCLWCID